MVGLLWTRDRPVWQNTTLTKDTHPWSSLHSNPQSRPTPQTARPPGSIFYVVTFIIIIYFCRFSLTSVHKSPKDYRCYKQSIRYAPNGSNLVPLETGQAVFFCIVASRAPAELQTEPLANRCSSYRNPWSIIWAWSVPWSSNRNSHKLYNLLVELRIMAMPQFITQRFWKDGYQKCHDGIVVTTRDGLLVGGWAHHVHCQFSYEQR